MPQFLRVSPVERLVDAYLQKFRKTKSIRGERKILDKAFKYIGMTLKDPCCAPVEELTFDTYKETGFLVSLKGTLNGIDVRKWKKSLERAQAKIDKILNDPCCPVPIFSVQGFGAAENVCVGESVSFFSNTEAIEVGTALYQNELLTPVTFVFFRDDTTGIIYTVVDGVVTGVSGDNCTQALQIQNLTGNASIVSGAEVDDVPVTFTGGVDFPIANSQVGDFKTDSVSPAFRTFKITVTGGTQIIIVDSALNNFIIPVAGPGTYTQVGVYFSGPNMDTAGVGITLL